MPKKLFKRLTPDPRKLREHKHLRFFGKLLHNPNLWHLNRRSASYAAALGLFMAFLPIPFQTIPAAALAIVLQINLPITLALVWLTNPLTVAPVFYFTYKLGSLMLGRPPQDLLFEPTWDWLWAKLAWIWQPFVLGSVTLSIASALLGYFLVQGLWRLHVIRGWNKRKKGRQARELI